MYPPALAIPRNLQLLPEQARQLTNGLATLGIHSTVDARRGHNFDVTILLSPSGRERLPSDLKKVVDNQLSYLLPLVQIAHLE
jgi:hypothetical protein